MAESVKLPSNVEAEKNVLGACLVSKSAATTAISLLTEECFSDENNRFVYQAMKALLDRGEPVDASTVTGELHNLKVIDQIGGTDYILELSDQAVVPENVEYYVNIVKDQYVLRKFLLAIRQCERDYATKPIENVGDFVTEVSNNLAKISQERNIGGFKKAEDICKMVEKDINSNRGNGQDDLIGVDTGYKRLNLFTHGWRKGDLIICAARPAMGKTALAMNLAYNAAYKAHVPVAFFSLEMSSVQIMQRLLACRSQVTNEHIQTGCLSGNERVKVASALAEIGSCPLYFDDTPNCLLGDILAKSTKLKNSCPELGMIVIDYLGIVRTTKTGKVESRQQEVQQVTGALKQMARELQVPVILVCQVNRDAEGNDNKRPSMSNLRESGSIEQDADQILLLYREDYYTSTGQSVGKKNAQQRANDVNNPGQPQPQPQKNDSDEASVMEVIVAKNRQGKTGTVKLIFTKQFSRFDDPSPEFEAQAARIEANAMNNGYLE